MLRCIKSLASPVRIYLLFYYRSPNGSARCICECEQVGAFVFCARGRVASVTHLVVAHWRNEEKTKGQERTLCLNGDPVVRTCALFNGEWRAPAEGKDSKWVACVAEGCENALLKKHAHLSQSSWYCQQARSDLNRVKLLSYTPVLSMFASSIASISAELAC